jgi:hypothetical protein
LEAGFLKHIVEESEPHLSSQGSLLTSHCVSDTFRQSLGGLNFMNPRPAANSNDSAPKQKESDGARLSLPSWIFGSVLLAFILGVFAFAPPELPEFKQRILAWACSLAAGIFTFFMSGDIGLHLVSVKSNLGKITLKATGGLAAFVLVLWWWTSSGAPVSITKQEMGDIVHTETTHAAQDITKHNEQSAAEIKDEVKREGEETRTVVQDSALSTLETMFPLAVRIPRC